MFFDTRKREVSGRQSGGGKNTGTRRTHMTSRSTVCTPLGRALNSIFVRSTGASVFVGSTGWVCTGTVQSRMLPFVGWNDAWKTLTAPSFSEVRGSAKRQKGERRERMDGTHTREEGRMDGRIEGSRDIDAPTSRSLSMLPLPLPLPLLLCILCPSLLSFPALRVRGMDG